MLTLSTPAAPRLRRTDLNARRMRGSGILPVNEWAFTFFGFLSILLVSSDSLTGGLPPLRCLGVFLAAAGLPERGAGWPFCGRNRRANYPRVRRVVASALTKRFLLSTAARAREASPVRRLLRKSCHPQGRRDRSVLPSPSRCPAISRATYRPGLLGPSPRRRGTSSVVVHSHFPQATPANHRARSDDDRRASVAAPRTATAAPMASAAMLHQVLEFGTPARPTQAPPVVTLPGPFATACYQTALAS